MIISSFCISYPNTPGGIRVDYEGSQLALYKPRPGRWQLFHICPASEGLSSYEVMQCAYKVLKRKVSP